MCANRADVRIANTAPAHSRPYPRSRVSSLEIRAAVVLTESDGRVLKPAAVEAGLGEWVRDGRRLRASRVGFHTFRHTCPQCSSGRAGTPSECSAGSATTSPASRWIRTCTYSPRTFPNRRSSTRLPEGAPIWVRETTYGRSGCPRMDQRLAGATLHSAFESTASAVACLNARDYSSPPYSMSRSFGRGGSSPSASSIRSLASRGATTASSRARVASLSRCSMSGQAERCPSSPSFLSCSSNASSSTIASSSVSWVVRANCAAWRTLSSSRKISSSVAAVMATLLSARKSRRASVYAPARRPRDSDTGEGLRRTPKHGLILAGSAVAEQRLFRPVSRQCPITMPADEPLTCVECGRKQPAGELGWQALLTDDSEEPAGAVVSTSRPLAASRPSCEH
jgi:hypothetical protein